jgi:polyisoprenyl-teichoic acid--peptidoglycan teichoic acid transferase
MLDGRRKKSKKKLIGRLLLFIISFILLFSLAVGGVILYNANVTWEEVYEDRGEKEDPIAQLRQEQAGKKQAAKDKPKEKKDQKGQVKETDENDSDNPSEDNEAKPVIKNYERKAFTIALLGVDTRDNNSFKGRSDTMIVAVFNPETKKVTLLSIPRDSYVYIPQVDKYDKIAHAHAYGRAAGAVETLENFLDIPIDYYISINFHAFRSLIEELGGITINVEKNMIGLQKGTQRLNADAALSYVRFRYDREGDFGRNRRQQQMVKAIIDQTLEIRNPLKITSLLKILGKNIRTDISLDNLIYLAQEFSNVNSSNIDSILLTGTPFYYNKRSYVGISNADLVNVRRKMKQLIYVTSEF